MIKSHLYNNTNKKPKFKDLVFTTLSNTTLNNIPKIMIFVNSIGTAIVIMKFLYSKLFKNINATKRVNQII